MKYSFIILLLLLTLSVFAADVVYKAEKEVKTADRKPVVIGEFEAGKYKTLRVGVSAEQIERGFTSVIVETVEGSEVYRVESFAVNSASSNSATITTVGKKLRVSVTESGKYKLVAWGE